MSEMVHRLPEPYRYGTETGSMRVHKVREGEQERDQHGRVTVCQWSFSADSCLGCGADTGSVFGGVQYVTGKAKKEDSSSGSEDQQSAVSQ